MGCYANAILVVAILVVAILVVDCMEQDSRLSGCPCLEHPEIPKIRYQIIHSLRDSAIVLAGATDGLRLPSVIADMERAQGPARGGRHRAIAFGIPRAVVPARAGAQNGKFLFSMPNPAILRHSGLPTQLPTDYRAHRVRSDKASRHYGRDAPPGLARSRCHWVIQLRLPRRMSAKPGATSLSESR